MGAENRFTIGSCDKIILIGLLRSLDPRNIISSLRKDLEIDSVTIALGSTEYIRYRIRFVVDIPLRRDIIREYDMV